MSETNNNNLPSLNEQFYSEQESTTEKLSSTGDAGEQSFGSTEERVDGSEKTSEADLEQANLITPLPDSSTISSECSQKKIDWHKLAHKLREHNRQLLKKIFKLEQEIAEVNNRLGEQIHRSQRTDLLIAQQAEELNCDREEIARLVGELEKSQQEKQSQQSFIENLSHQLKESQEQIAQLERECAFLQENCNKQTQELIVKEEQTQELNSRLHRQQSYTLQYKAALDQYLNISSVPTKTKNEQKVSEPSFRFGTKPIQAWSIALEGKEIAAPKASYLNLPTENSADHLPSKSSKQEAPVSPKIGTADNGTQSKETNWPSPAIATANAEKKPKSLAAVDLPRFPRQGSQ